MALSAAKNCTIQSITELLQVSRKTSFLLHKMEIEINLTMPKKLCQPLTRKFFYSHFFTIYSKWNEMGGYFWLCSTMFLSNTGWYLNMFKWLLNRYWKKWDFRLELSLNYSRYLEFAREEISSMKKQGRNKPFVSQNVHAYYLIY